MQVLHIRWYYLLFCRKRQCWLFKSYCWSAYFQILAVIQHFLSVVRRKYFRNSSRCFNTTGFNLKVRLCWRHSRRSRHYDRHPTKSEPILTDFESLFIQAKQLKGDWSQVMLNHSTKAQLPSRFVYTGLPTSLASIMVNQDNPNVNYSLAAADKQLEMIMTQKWVASMVLHRLNLDWLQKNRFPFLLTLQYYPGRAKDYPPVRLLYPQDELNVNSANVLAVGTIDLFTSKIFWQKR